MASSGPLRVLCALCGEPRQVIQVEQTLILVDERDNVLGYAPRGECHRGDGRLHRAIAVLLFDGDGRVLLQKRQSPLWDGFWDITAATHPLHLAGASARDESYEEAAAGCLEREWGVVASVEPILSFTYFERFGDSCERERCLLLAGRRAGPVRLNPLHGYDMRWVKWDDYRREVERDPSAHTPWARIVVERLSAEPHVGKLPLR